MLVKSCLLLLVSGSGERPHRSTRFSRAALSAACGLNDSLGNCRCGIGVPPGDLQKQMHKKLYS